MSETAGFYIAGLIRHCNEFFPITNQWINSYKRIVKGYESPTLAGWSRSDPRTIIRVPMCRDEKPNSMRIELRNPDPSCNPYLAFSVILASGLEGIEKKYKLPDPLENDDSAPRKNKHSESSLPPLPRDLHEAVTHFENSKLMRETLGEYIHKKFIENKMLELERFNNYITDYEINEYLPIL
jgi:glutamine synthetase